MKGLRIASAKYFISSYANLLAKRAACSQSGPWFQDFKVEPDEAARPKRGQGFNACHGRFMNG